MIKELHDSLASLGCDVQVLDKSAILINGIVEIRSNKIERPEITLMRGLLHIYPAEVFVSNNDRAITLSMVSDDGETIGHYVVREK